MIETIYLVVDALIGGMLGIVFYGGLWWTIHKGVSSPQPAIWFLGSWLVRMSVVLAGFYLAGHGHWQRLVACLLGFTVARFVVTYYRTRLPSERPSLLRPEGNHAP